MYGFPKKRSLDWGWVDGVSSIQVYFEFLEFFNFAKPLIESSKCRPTEIHFKVIYTGNTFVCLHSIPRLNTSCTDSAKESVCWAIIMVK